MINNIEEQMNQPWCCVTCRAKFMFGELIGRTDSPLLHCPACGSSDVYIIDGRNVSLDLDKETVREILAGQIIH